MVQPPLVSDAPVDGLPQVRPYANMSGSTHSSRDSLHALERISRHVGGLQQWVQTELRLIRRSPLNQLSTSLAVSRKLHNKPGSYFVVVVCAF